MLFSVGENATSSNVSESDASMSKTVYSPDMSFLYLSSRGDAASNSGSSSRSSTASGSDAKSIPGIGSGSALVAAGSLLVRAGQGVELPPPLYGIASSKAAAAAAGKGGDLLLIAGDAAQTTTVTHC